MACEMLQHTIFHHDIEAACLKWEGEHIANVQMRISRHTSIVHCIDGRLRDINRVDMAVARGGRGQRTHLAPEATSNIKYAHTWLHCTGLQ